MLGLLLVLLEPLSLRQLSLLLLMSLLLPFAPIAVMPRMSPLAVVVRAASALLVAPTMLLSSVPKQEMA